MDTRIVESIEAWLGCPISDGQNENRNVRLLTTSSRSDVPYNRLVINRIVGENAIIATCIPRLFDTLETFLGGITEWELFSNYGVESLRNLMTADDARYLGQGFSYAKFRADNAVDPKMDSIFPRMDADGVVSGFSYILDDREVSSVKFSRRDSSGTIFIDVKTKEQYRGKGFGTAVVNAATNWLLINGFVPRYGAEVSNTPSLSIARRLRFNLISHHIVC